MLMATTYLMPPERACLFVLTAALPPGFPKQNSTDNGECGVTKNWEACSTDPEKCNAAQVGVLNQYILDFNAAIQRSATYSRAGNGAFIHSCHKHCEAESSSFWTIKIRGVTMQQALGKWWNSNGTDAASTHSYAPCLYQTSSPHKCNPTCLYGS